MRHSRTGPFFCTSAPLCFFCASVPFVAISATSAALFLLRARHLRVIILVQFQESIA
jgi:hypothetical protein